MKKDKIYNIRHSLAHLLAMAVKEKDPEAKFAIGPVVDNGFYYDFEFSEGFSLSDKDLKDIQKRMKKLISKKIDFVEKEITEKEALEIFKDQPYKLELIKEFAEENKKITIYESGTFTDLCEGPHVKNSEAINTDAFKLTRLAGAYWRGDEKNIMLTRVYGVAFETKEELDAYLTQQEEAKKRDHRKLGKQLGLYTIDPNVGIGLPLWKPAGAMILTVLRRWFEDEQLKLGYVPVSTPHIGRKTLWETSGHWGFYNDSMYPPIELGQTLEDYQDKRPAKESETYLLKPMNCPFHMAIYNDDLHSYRELPLKYYEFGTVYRYEQKGELGGLTRVRGFTQDDAHIFCTKKQLNDELTKIIDFAFYVLKETFGFEIIVYASFRDQNNKDKYLGEDEDWDIAEQTIKDMLKEKGIDYIEEPGEAAFYGPKMDFKVKDSLGREWQLSTIQVDFNLPERFDMHYKNAEGKDVRPFIIHRALLGSLERFMGILIEHYAGAFPLWLSPIQVRVLPIADSHKEYAEEIFEALKNARIRTEIDDSNETLGKKIRNCKLQKIPYFLVIGDKEVESKTVTVESRDRGNEGAISVEKLLQKLQKEITEKQKPEAEKK